MPRRCFGKVTRGKNSYAENWELKQGWEGGGGDCLLKGNIFLGAYNTLISFLPQSNSSTKNFSSSASVAVPARAKQLVSDESGILKKELNKAYERIAALEGRNQELTLHTTGVCM